jgi:phosphopantetheine adenylyltransferase
MGIKNLTWNIEVPDGKRVKMTSEQVIKLLSDKVMEVEKEDIDQLVVTLADYLEANSMLRNLRAVDTIHLGFAIGYYYRVFLEKNDVQLENKDGNTTSNSGDIEAPGSSLSSNSATD